MQKLKRWPLDYGWGHRHWNVRSDVALEAQFSGADASQALTRVRSWIASLAQHEFRLDGNCINVGLDGGIRAYAEETSLWLHSSGEDAFDSLHYYAGHIVDLLKDLRLDDIGIKWVQHPHRRKTHLLK